MIEVKPCPFCGQQPAVRWSMDKEEFVAGCINAHCPAFDMPMALISEWNKRTDEKEVKNE